MKRASDAKLEGIVEEQREGRGQGEVELDARVGFPTQIARGIASRGKRVGTHFFAAVAESFSGASFCLPPVNQRERSDCFMLGPVAATACSRNSSRHACSSDPGSGCREALPPHGV